MGRTQQQYLHRLVSVQAAHLLQTAGIMLVGFLALLQLLKHDVEVREQGLRAQLAQEGMDLISGLEQQLTSNLHLAEGLAATIIAIPDISKMQLDAAIQHLFHDGRYMRNIGVAPGNRISNIYPLQGGIGLINRKPVFLEDGSYWGIISLVLDSAPVTLELNIPGADWKLALAPVTGWSPGVFLSRLQVGLGVLFILAVALAFLAFRTVITSLKAKDAHMRAVLDSSMDSVVVLDHAGFIVDCNHAASGLFGYAESELLHQHASRLYVDERLRREELYSDAAATPGQSRRIEISGRRSNGEQFAMELSIGGMRRGGEGSFVWVMRDISSRKQAEAALQRLASVDPLTGAMNRRAFMQPCRLPKKCASHWQQKK